jgi:L-2,4-diaminobutyrate decarboxylase
LTDPSFSPNREGLELALDAILNPPASSIDAALDPALPEAGVGEIKTLELLAPIIIGGARRLGDATAFAHMDPPTPWITWATALWNAALNQNLLHPDVAPVARDIEKRVVSWLAPYFGMAGGHMTPGSTVANLTALWAARELKGIKRVVTSKAAHLSVAKSAHILGLRTLNVGTNSLGQIDAAQLPADLSDAALVLTAGTTSAGAIDDLSLANRAAWVHVDAAWAGPLRLSNTHRDRLEGIDKSDSVSISPHKWFFQPKESGLVLFKDVAAANRAVSYGGEYLTAPNIGLLGSHGASAVPLLATLLSWGRTGLEERIDAAMTLSNRLFTFLSEQPNVKLYAPNTSGVILWNAEECIDAHAIIDQLPEGSASIARVDGSDWVRHVPANPNAAVEILTSAIEQVLDNAACAPPVP